MPATSQPAQTPVLDAPRLNLAWLLKLRWFAILGQAVAIAVAVWAMGIELPLGLLISILGLELVSNWACGVWAARQTQVTETGVAALMAFDVVLLTALLHLTGGPFNPFSSLYLVHIALAAVALRPAFTWALSGFSFVAFGLLFFLPQGADHAMHHADHMRMHLQGMWVAFGIAALFIAYFVTRVARDLAQRELELAEARAQALKSERLASLATLAAGAAHELASPLSTIAVASSELLLHLQRQQASSDIQSDVMLIRQEVERCRTILNQMAHDAGQSAGEGFTPVTPRQLVTDATEGVDPKRLRFALDERVADEPLSLPRRAVGQALRAVVNNALDATEAAAETVVSASASGGALQLVVDDPGSGMPPDVLAHAGEPFFTTKQPGQGMGLGLFLSRAVVHRLGGDLQIVSTQGRGTRVTLSLPQGRGNLSH